MLKATFAGMLAALPMLAGPVGAQDYPARPITLIIPFAAGGPTDVLGRTIAARMGEILGKQIVVENVAGGGGQVGSKRVADAPPDGYLLGLGTVGTHAQGQTLYKKPLYNSATDFAPVALLADVPIVVVVRKDLPATDLASFTDYAKRHHRSMSYGTGGTGSAPHLGCLLLDHALGTSITHVPYRGSAPALQDLVGGRIDFSCAGITTAKPLIESAVVRGLALLGGTRSPVMPDLPTAVEQGLKVEAYTWNALFLPKGAPETIVHRLAAAARETISTPGVRDRLAGLGAQVVPGDQATPEYLARFVRSETEKWAGPIRAAGLSAD
jgi:tripartite-type tricarboxylate transporter receptor subunit TctC